MDTIIDEQSAAQETAAEQLGASSDDVSYSYGVDKSGKKWLRAYLEEKGFSDKIYYE